MFDKAKRERLGPMRLANDLNEQGNQSRKGNAEIRPPSGASSPVDCIWDFYGKAAWSRPNFRIFKS